MHSMIRYKDERGFTLMELMVVIVIVAILAAVAVPLYINYVKDAQRTEAKGAIGAVVTAEQTFFQVNGLYYNSGFVANPAAADTSTQKLNCDLTEALQNWDIVVRNANNPNGFYVEATGKASRPAAGLYVAYQYDRSTPANTKWIETAPAAPPTP
jgi:prepilin-type N-terminal cleavage/methylation domain-containing protein